MADLPSLIDRYLAERWQREPVLATSMGIHQYDHELADFRPAAVEESHRRKQELLAAFHALDHARLSPLDRLDWRLAASELATDIAAHRLRQWERSPAMYADLAVTGVYLLTVREFAPLRQRLLAARDRLRAFASFFATARANLTPETPAVFVEIGEQTAAGGVEFLQEAIPPLAAAVASEDPQTAAEVLAASEQAQRALRDFAAFLQELRRRAGGDFAIGRELFDFFLRHNHFLDFDADGLYALGERYFAETAAQLDALAAQLSPGKSWPALVEELKQNHPPAEGLLAAYQQEMERARQFSLARGLATLAPGEVLQVVETPSFLRGVLPYAAYDPPPPFDADMRGLFYVTPLPAAAPAEVREQQLQGHCYYALPVIALHEGYPGHHLQLARAKLIESPIRRMAQSTVFVEGWALYCEEMMHEVGFYPDLRVRLFQLKDTLWRAARVMIDVGLHCRGLTFGQAVDLLVDRVKLERPHAEAEVRRYTTTPTQPMSYLVGKHLILDLRRQYQSRLGSAFSLREFHDRLLSFGSVPPPLVSEQMLPDSP